MIRRLANTLLPALLATGFVSGLIAIFPYICPYSLGWNRTESIPSGIYLARRYQGEALARGDLVCFKFAAPTWARDRSYLPEGQRLCKPIAGLPGDELAVSQGKLLVASAGRPAQEYKLLEADSQRRPLPSDALKNGKVAEGQLLLIANHRPNSLDSRYLGTVQQSQLTNRIWPLWVDTDN